MGVRRRRWLDRSARACVFALATLGCGESASRGEQTSATGGSAGSPSGAGGTTSGAAGTNGASASGGTSLGGSGGSPSGGSVATGGASAGSSGSAAGGGGASAGASGAAGGPECPSVRTITEEGFVVTIEPNETLVFQQNPVFYAGRPPLLELYASTDAPGWLTFKIVLDSGDAPFAPGIYRGGPGTATYIQVRGNGADYDCIDNDACTVCLTSVGTEPGARVEGTFGALLENNDGVPSLDVSGTFSGVIAPL